MFYVAGDQICLIYGKSDLIENHVFRIIADIL